MCGFWKPFKSLKTHINGAATPKSMFRPEDRFGRYRKRGPQSCLPDFCLHDKTLAVSGNRHLVPMPPPAHRRRFGAFTLRWLLIRYLSIPASAACCLARRRGCPRPGRLDASMRPLVRHSVAGAPGPSKSATMRFLPPVKRGGHRRAVEGGCRARLPGRFACPRRQLRPGVAILYPTSSRPPP